MKRGLFACVLLLACAGAARFSSANFTSSSGNPANAVTVGTVGAASAVTATPSGNNVQVSWGAGTNANSYTLTGGTSASSSSCAAVTFGTSIAAPATLSYTDSRSTPAGTYYCYRVQSAFHSFTGTAATQATPVQLGVVASAVTLTNSFNLTGCTGSHAAAVLDCGDRIVIDFNQPMSTSSGPGSSSRVCGVNNGSTLMIGYTGATNACAATSTPTLGKLNGVTTSPLAVRDATFTWSNGNARLTVLIGARSAGSPGKDVGLGSGTWTFTPAASLQSAAGPTSICTANTGGAQCLPTVAQGL